MPRYATVVRTWYVGAGHRIGQRGRVLGVRRSSLERSLDAFQLRFKDGKIEQFDRNEIRFGEGR